MNEIDLRDGHKDDDVLGMVAAAALENEADQLGLVRLELAMGTAMDKTCLDAVLASAIRTMRAAGKALAGGAAVIALALAGLLLPGASPQASAATVAVEAPQPDPSPVVCPRHATTFQRGLWINLGNGDVAVSAPLRELVGRLGWLPSPWALVNVQQLRRGRWVTVATLRTSAADGRANGIVHVGGGVKYLRVVHPQDMWTLAATGATRRVVVTTEPFDIV